MLLYMSISPPNRATEISNESQTNLVYTLFVKHLYKLPHDDGRISAFFWLYASAMTIIFYSCEFCNFPLRDI